MRKKLWAVRIRVSELHDSIGECNGLDKVDGAHVKSGFCPELLR